MHRDIIVVGASAGGVEALCDTISGLPDDLPAAVFIVLHLPSTATSVLPAVLQRHSALCVAAAVDGEAIEHGRVYVAPPDHHLLIRAGAVELSRGPRENGHRPAVDPLFRSAARAYGARVIGVVLSGALDDGAMGLSVIVQSGGIAMVQDPNDAAFPGMPQSAMDATPVEVCAPAARLGELLGAAATVPIEAPGVEMMSDAVPADTSIEPQPTPDDHNPPSVFTCPECHGTLFEVKEGAVARYRCRVGHGFSADSLLAGQSDSLEAAIWTALRALEERNDLLRRMAARAHRQDQPQAAMRFEERLRDSKENADILRRVLTSGETARDEAS